MFCLSKGLGAPVGSMLVGRADQIDRGRIYRKALGGGMRQAGILAAAGLIALEQGPAKLATDHANAKFLAEGLAQIPGFKIDPAKVQTNILICDISGTGMTSAELSQAAARARRAGQRRRPAGDSLCHPSRCLARAVREGAGDSSDGVQCDGAKGVKVRGGRRMHGSFDCIRDSPTESLRMTQQRDGTAEAVPFQIAKSFGAAKAVPFKAEPCRLKFAAA